MDLPERPYTFVEGITVEAKRNAFVLDRKDFDLFLKAIKNRGYTLIGPRIQEGAVVYGEISSTHDLPIGWADEQKPGSYRLKKRPDSALFGYTVAPQSWKRFLYPPELRLWRARKTSRGFQIEHGSGSPVRYAFLGVRACELHAIAVQDCVFLEGPYVDPVYQARRENALIIAVNCTYATQTCFCTTMGTGPRVQKGYDLALTELLGPDRHEFLVEVSSVRGQEILSEVPTRNATSEDWARAQMAIQQAEAAIAPVPGMESFKTFMKDKYDHPHWDEIAARCLSCGNCTMVCPTCFCVTVEDFTDLTGQTAERVRRWDSCFSLEFSYIHGGNLRQSVKSRYRQWLMHKLVTWWDQFQMSGCVGCGRCITWCPVGIDLREEVQAFQQGEGMAASRPMPGKKEERVS